MLLTIKWFPRSWLQICYDEFVIYIDPSYMKTYFKNCPTKIEFATGPGEDDGLPEDLPPGDIILITHSHKDHCKSSTIDRLSSKDTLIYAPTGCRSELNRSFHSVRPGDSIALEKIRIETVEAYNTPLGSSVRKVHKKGAVIGYVLTLGNIRLYHAGDSDHIPEMAALKNIDIAFLPIGGTFTMNVDEAVQAALAINPKTVVPIHHLNADPVEFKMKLQSFSSQINVRLLLSGEEWLP